ncbi:MAG: glycosyltransferase [Myxococcota bacterium]
MILYVRSDRGANSARRSRKIDSICETWRELGFEVDQVCGGDVIGAAGSSTGIPAPPKQPGPWTTEPGLKGFAASLRYSVSEFRDIRHDKVLKAFLLERFGSKKPELIWHRASRLHLAPMQAARELGVPYVLEWIDALVAYDHSLFRARALAADRERMKAAFRVLVVSEAWKRDIAAEYGVPMERIIVSHNAVYPEQFVRDPEAGKRIREKMKIPANAFVVGFVGSYAWFHQVHMIAEAAARLRERGIGPVYWLAVGEGPNRQKLDAISTQLGVDDLVIRQGRVPHDEVSHWLSAMDAAVMMSIGGEIIVPVKVPEYMAAALAPIVAETPASREVVDDGRTGLLFRPDDSASMADAVARLVASPGLAGELGRAACEEAKARFTWKRTWGKALLDIAADAGILPAASTR